MGDGSLHGSGLMERIGLLRRICCGHGSRQLRRLAGCSHHRPTRIHAVRRSIDGLTRALDSCLRPFDRFALLALGLGQLSTGILAGGQALGGFSGPALQLLPALTQHLVSTLHLSTGLG